MKNIRELRKKMGVSQTQCAADTGVPLKTLRRYEYGHNIGNIGYANSLARYFGVTLDDLLEEAEENQT